MSKVRQSDYYLCTYSFVFLFCSIAAAQNNGRFDEAKRAGMSLVQGEQYDRAAGRLEEVWEQDHSDLSVGEFLALAYLNTEDRRSLPQNQKQAFAIINELTAKGGRVSFMVLHSHEKSLLGGHELSQYCRGRLSISGDHLIFVADKGEKAGQHSFEITGKDFKSASFHEGDERGTFDISLKSGSYFMATRNRNRDEARLIVNLVRQSLGGK